MKINNSRNHFIPKHDYQTKLDVSRLMLRKDYSKETKCGKNYLIPRQDHQKKLDVSNLMLQ